MPTVRGLFPAAPDFHFTPFKTVAAVLAVIAGAAISLVRIGGPGALNSIWAEDGRNFLTDAFNLGARDAISTPFNGYFHVGPRLLAEVASRFPLEYTAPILAIEAALVAAVFGLIVYVASAASLRHPALRLLVSVPAVIPPVAVNIVDNNVATLQFFWLYVMFWVLLWRPSSRGGQAVAVGVVLLGALSTPVAITLIPLALLRIAAVRDRLGFLLTAGLGAGVAVQFGALLLGYTVRGVTTARYDVAWVLGDFITKAVPQAFFGEALMGGGDWLNFPEWTRGGHQAATIGNPALHYTLIALSWLIVAALIITALRWTKPAWTLAIVAFLFSAGLFAFAGMAGGSTPARYFVAPALLILTSAAALLIPAENAKRHQQLPLAALITLVAVVCVANLRADSFRTYGVPWTQVVQQARSECADPAATHALLLTNMPQLLWDVKIPCAKARS